MVALILHMKNNVKTQKKVLINAIVALMFLSLLYLNYFYFGFGFENRFLDYVLSMMFFLIMIFLSINGVILFRHRQLYGLILFLCPIFILLYLFMYSFIWFHHETIDSLTFDDHDVVDVYFYPSDRIYVFMKKEPLLGFFNARRCIYWAMSLSPDRISWAATADTLSFSGMSVGVDGVNVDIDDPGMLGTPCSCYNDFDVELNICDSNQL